MCEHQPHLNGNRKSCQVDKNEGGGGGKRMAIVGCRKKWQPTVVSSQTITTKVTSMLSFKV